MEQCVFNIILIAAQCYIAISVFYSD